MFFYLVQTSALIAGPVSTWLEFTTLFDYSPGSASSLFNACVMPLSSAQTIALDAFSPLQQLGFLLFTALVQRGIRCCREGWVSAPSPTAYGRTAIALVLSTYQQVPQVMRPASVLPLTCCAGHRRDV